MIEIGEKLAVILGATLVISLKLAVLVVAFKTIRLGHDLLLRGVKGEFSFSGSAGGLSADLKSVSPGLLFVLLGVSLALTSVIAKFPQSVETKQRYERTARKSWHPPATTKDDLNIEKQLENDEIH
jgi:hypothetical protein